MKTSFFKECIPKKKIEIDGISFCTNECDKTTARVCTQNQPNKNASR